MPGKPRDHRPAEYVSLPVHFAQNAKVAKIIARFESQGYHFALAICLHLATCKGFECEATKSSYEELADDMDLEYKDLKKMMDFAIQKNFLQVYTFKDGSKWFRCQYLETIMLDQLLKSRARKRKYTQR